MRTVKFLAAVLMLTLAGAVYVAGAMQDATNTKENEKAAKSCCKKQNAAPAPSPHGAQTCCSAGGCDHQKGAHAGAQKTTAADEKAGCCSGGKECCAGGGRDCCKEGASCCKGGATDCCKAHKTASTRSVAGAGERGTAAHRCCGSCADRGGESGHKAHTRGR